MNERGCKSVGIDLGTTYSALAYIDAQMMPRIVPDSNGQTVIPSVVYFDEAELIVGDIALQQAKLHSDRVVQFAKVHIGDEWKFEFAGQVHTPESISAIILAYLLREAEPQIGPISSAVITVPAYFTEKRRRATQQAGEIAGLEVIGTLNEPMAAALSHGLYQTGNEQVAVVYDLGGGTFDVTIVRISPNELEELATFGNRKLGGKDWDQCLIDHVAEDFKKSKGVDPRESPQAAQDLIITCEQAKRHLSRMKKTPIRLHAMGHDHVCEVTRDQFETMTAHLLQTTKLTTELALEDAGVGWSDVSRLVLVGGSTHMPMVRNMLGQVSGRQPDTGVNPVLAVALGAAQYAQLLESGKAPEMLRPKENDSPSDAPSDAVSIDVEQPTISLPRVGFVTAHGVGVRAISRGKPKNVVLINRNSRVPFQVSRQFVTHAAKGGRNALRITVTQGDSEDLDLVEVLGTGRIRGLPPDEPSGQPVEVTMSFDEQGRLHVYAVYVPTGQDLRIDLDIPGSLAEDEVKEYRKMLEGSNLFEPIELDDMVLDVEFDDDDDEEDALTLEPID